VLLFAIAGGVGTIFGGQVAELAGLGSLAGFAAGLAALSLVLAFAALRRVPGGQ
jgi:hypothetical protein